MKPKYYLITFISRNPGKDIYLNALTDMSPTMWLKWMIEKKYESDTIVLTNAIEISKGDYDAAYATLEYYG